MDRAYVLSEIDDRLNVLHKRYKKIISDTTLYKSYNTARVSQSLIKRDYNMCMLFKELLLLTDVKSLDLSDEALEGLTRLIEPNEKGKR